MAFWSPLPVRVAGTEPTGRASFLRRLTATLTAAASITPLAAVGMEGMPLLSPHASAAETYAFDRGFESNMRQPVPLPLHAKLGDSVGQVVVRGGGTNPVELHFRAAAPGADYSVKGREDAPVAVQVDGHTQAIVPIYSENADATGYGSYDVNLGVLADGAHTVQLRTDSGLVGPHAPLARVEGVSTSVDSGLQAQLDRYAPILFTKAPYTSDPRETLVHTDAPVLLRGQVDGDPDGYHRLSYYVTLTDEDAGTPDLQRNQVWGRFTDDEWVYRVLLDGNGNKVSEGTLDALKSGARTEPAWNAFLVRMGVQPGTPAAQSFLAQEVPWSEAYQYGNDLSVRLRMQMRHYPTRFDGIYQGDRPVIADNSGNNNFWALPRQSLEQTAPTSLTVYFRPSQGVKSNARGQVTQLGVIDPVQILKDVPLPAKLSAQERKREGNH